MRTERSANRAILQSLDGASPEWVLFRGRCSATRTWTSAASDRMDFGGQGSERRWGNRLLFGSASTCWGWRRFRPAARCGLSVHRGQRCWSRTARSRNSGEYGFDVFFFCACSITGNSPRVLPSGKPGAVHTASCCHRIKSWPGGLATLPASVRRSKELPTIWSARRSIWPTRKATASKSMRIRHEIRGSIRLQE